MTARNWLGSAARALFTTLLILLQAFSLATVVVSAERRAREPVHNENRGAHERTESGSDVLEQRKREREATGHIESQAEGALGQHLRESEASKRDARAEDYAPKKGDMKRLTDREMEKLS